jgi:hypothetical protein
MLSSSCSCCNMAWIGQMFRSQWCTTSAACAYPTAVLHSQCLTLLQTNTPCDAALHAGSRNVCRSPALCAAAASGGHIHVLAWLRQQVSTAQRVACTFLRWLYCSAAHACYLTLASAPLLRAVVHRICTTPPLPDALSPHQRLKSIWKNAAALNPLFSCRDAPGMMRPLLRQLLQATSPPCR